MGEAVRRVSCNMPRAQQLGELHGHDTNYHRRGNAKQGWRCQNPEGLPQHCCCVQLLSTGLSALLTGRLMLARVHRSWFLSPKVVVEKHAVDGYGVQYGRLLSALPWPRTVTVDINTPTVLVCHARDAADTRMMTA